MINFPVGFYLGESFVYLHAITDILSFLVAFQVYYFLRNRQGDKISDDFRLSIIIGATLGALIGSRLLAALEDPALFFNPSSFIYYISGKTIAGAIIGGIIGVEIAKKIIGEKKSSGDLFVFPLIVGMIIGRIGCFFTGVMDKTVGLPSNLPWAIDQGDGILRHPTSLYEIVFLMIFGTILWFAQKRKFKSGVLFRVFVLGYFFFRFLIEFIKPLSPLLFGLSAIQIASLIICVCYVWSLYKIYKR